MKPKGGVTPAHVHCGGGRAGFLSAERCDGGEERDNPLHGCCNPHECKISEKHPTELPAVRYGKGGIRTFGGQAALQVSELPQGSDFILQLCFLQGLRTMPTMISCFGLLMPVSKYTFGKAPTEPGPAVWLGVVRRVTLPFWRFFFLNVL